MAGTPQECQARTAAPTAALALNKPGLCGRGGGGAGGCPDREWLVPRSESYGTGAPGERGCRPCFLLTLQMAEEALRGESIIDEESGCASALSGGGVGTLAQATAR